MHRDPHDALLLTSRPTTVVTQATRLLDDMPAPYGDQGDEENIFAGISADDSDFDNRQAVADTRKQAVAATTGTLPLAKPMTAPAQPAPSIWPAVALLGGLVGLTWLLGGRRS